MLYNPGMTTILVGERVGKRGRIRLGCSAVLFDPAMEQVLLTRRADNGQWCLPGGAIDPGETVTEACGREFYEETGLRVRVVRLTGVYSTPDQLVVYPDGTRVQIIALNFLVELLGGEMVLTSETTAIRYFPVAEAVSMDLFHSHAERIRDAARGEQAAIIK